ncbi:MAG: substrate-binding periplasmic protein [Marinobacter sp.]
MARLLLAALLLLPMLTAGADETLTVGYVDFPPYQFQNEAGEADGRFVELTRKVAEEAGYELEFVYLPTARVYFYLEIGAIDLWQGFADNPSLGDDVLESETTPLKVAYGVWYLPSTPEPRAFPDLYGTTLITITGYNYAGLASYLDQSDDIRAISTTGHQSALDMLKKGRGQYLLDYQEPVLDRLMEQPVPGIRFTPMWVREAAWLFSRASDEAEQRRRDFDEAWQRLVSRGEVVPIGDAGPARPMEGLPL